MWKDYIRENFIVQLIDLIQKCDTGMRHERNVQILPVIQKRRLIYLSDKDRRMK